MNVYMVWSECLCEDGWRPDYYLFIAAETHSSARYEYARFGGWESEAFTKSPEGFVLHCHLVEKDVPYSRGELYRYEETAGVDLILAGVLLPMWMVNGFSAEYEYDYRRWNGFRRFDGEETTP